jgi:thioredoxin 1
MLRRLFVKKPNPPTIPLEYRTVSHMASHMVSSTISDSATSASTLSEGGAAQPGVHEVVDEAFERTVLQSDRLAVVDFWAEWCPPCEIMSLYALWLARDYGERLLVAALDVDENPITPERYNIMGLPTLLFFRGGVEVDRQVGILSYDELQVKVETLLAQP